MEELSLSEFLNIDTKNKYNMDSIFNYADRYLNELQSNDFPQNKGAILDTVIGKYRDCGSEFLKDKKELDVLVVHAERLRDQIIRGIRRISPFEIVISFVKVRNSRVSYYNRLFNTLYGHFIMTYRLIIEERKKIEFEGYFNPENTNKDRIKFLIEKCIYLVENDENLKLKAKKKLIKELKTIITQLESPYSNWAIILGKIKESIFILGALGGIATGAINIINEVETIPLVNNLNEAVNILHEVEGEIENSINITPEIFQDTFTFSNKIGAKKQDIKLFELPKPDSSHEKKKESEVPFTDFEEIEIIREEE